MTFTSTLDELRAGVGALCAQFDGRYWRDLDADRAYPEAFVDAMTAAGYLAALIPTTYGGMGLDLRAACAILEEVNRSGGNANAAHAQMYVMGVLLRYGSDEQKRRWLPQIADGRLRLQAFGVTEPDAGTDTTQITTTAERRGDDYVINGRKIYISRVQYSDLMVLLARTTPVDEVERRSDGLSVFLVDLRAARDHGLEVTPRRVMMNNLTNDLVLHDVVVPAANRIGDEGAGFRYILDGLNAERILIAAECVGDGRFFVGRASARARDRQVFDRPIGQNQGIAFPIARAYADVEAASLMVDRAAGLFDADVACGAEANMAKLLAADASWQAANVAVQTFGGYGVDAEYDIERKFRETRLYQVAPISTNLILSFLAEHVLDLPRSF
ncbi:acyl-CoA dehydrogenase family protein [soil metagenome]